MFKNALSNIAYNDKPATAEVSVDVDWIGKDGTINVKIFDPVLGQNVSKPIRYDGDVAQLISEVEKLANSVVNNYNQKNKGNQFGGSGTAGNDTAPENR